jgi:hypothetical protein
MITPAKLAQRKPEAAHVFRQQAPRCSYDHRTQVRRWDESPEMRQILMTTGAPTSSTTFDGEGDE